MTVIEQWWVVGRPNGPDMFVPDDAVKHYRTRDARHQGYRVQGPYVKAERLQGVVEALAEVTELARKLSVGGLECVSKETRARCVDLSLTAAGGQCAPAAAPDAAPAAASYEYRVTAKARDGRWMPWGDVEWFHGRPCREHVQDLMRRAEDVTVEIRSVTTGEPRVMTLDELPSLEEPEERS